MRARRVAAGAGIALGIIAVLLLGAMLILTLTDWGRERVRGFALDRIEAAIDGEIEIGRIEGNLLRGVRLTDVAIRDLQGRPFLEADTLETRFGLRALLRQRIELDDVRMVRAVVVLDKPPGEDWNYVRIFRLDPPDDVEPGPPGWGHWVALDDVTLVRSRLTVRTEWRPADGLTPAEREAAVRHALAAGTRERVVEVAGGYQNVMEFSQLNAELPRVLVAHPDTAGIPFEVARLSGLARPFSPPPARVRDLAGEFRIVRDSLFMSGVRAVLPGSRLTGGGVYALHSGDLLLIARGDPVAFADLRWLHPPLPEKGGGTLSLTLELGSVVNRIIVRDMDVAVGDATVSGAFDLTTGDTLRVGDADLRFARVETGLVERLLDFEFPRPGRLTGRLALRGLPRSLAVDGDVRFDDVAGPSSRVVARGGLGVEPDVRFSELRVQFSPLQAGLARMAVPELPVRGTIEGTAVLTGSLVDLELDADLALRDPRHGLSRVRLAGGIDRRDEPRLRDMVVRMDPLRLDLLRDELPELPAGATATGRVWLDGVPARALSLDGDIVVDDPATGVSGIGATGELFFEDEVRFRRLRLRFEPLQAELARVAVPELPVRGTIEGTAVVTGSPTVFELDADLALRDPRHGRSHVILAGGLDRREELRLRDMLVQVDPLRADVVRPWIPDFPAGGSFVGAVRLDGAPSRFLHVDGRVAHHHDDLGVSRVEARGGIGTAGPLEFRDLDLRLEPLHMALVRAFAPELPLLGTVTGTATLNGSPASRIAVQGDVVHEERGERSHVVGRADVATGPGGWAAVDVRLQPLSLNVVGRFVPAAGLHGSVAGHLRASGDLGDLTIDADLRAADGGAIRAVGTMDLAAASPVYDLDMRLRDFDLSAVTWRAPAETDLTGSVMARGRGLEPATMRATIAADLSGSGFDDVRADLVRLRLDLDAGLARVDSSIIRLGGAEAGIHGTFGLVEGRHGVLAYRVAVDSLHAFAPWLPGADVGVSRTVASTPFRPAAPLPTADRQPSPTPVAPPTPAAVPADDVVPRRYVAPDGARVTVTTTRVQTAIDRDDDEPQPTGIAPGAGLAADTAAARLPGDTAAAALPPADTFPPVAEVPAIRATADSLAGSLHAAGTARGNLTRFDLDGSAVIDRLLYRGAYVGGGDIEYALEDVGTSSPGIRLDAELREVRTGDLAFDQVSAQGRYRGVRGEGSGEVVVVAEGTDDTEYRADVAFDLSLARSELRIADLMLRFDTVTWQAERPGTLSWAGDAIELASIDVVSDAGGRVRLDGRLPVDGSGDLDVVIEELEVEQLVALLQLDQDVQGTLNIDARVQGTLEDPRINGTARLEEARLDGDPVPDLRASFRYAELELTADATLLHEGRELAVAEARLPIDLSLLPNIVPRLLPGELAVDIRADSLPIEAIPTLSQHIDDPRGRVSGDVAVRGTFDDPVVTGAIDLDLGSVRVVPLGVRIEEVAGRLSLDGDVVRLDSVVAHSGGPIRITGEIGIATLTDPTFALDVETRETRVISTDDVTLEVDADLTVGGSLAAIEVRGDVRTRSGVIKIPKLAELGETQVVSLHAPVRAERIEAEFLEELRRLERRRPLLDRLHVDVGLQVDRDVWLRSTEVNVEIYTPRDVGPLRVRMNGAEGGVALEGTLNTGRGEYEFMSRRFNLTRGAATFIGEEEIDPILQVAAEHEVRLPGREAFALRVLLGGTLRDVEITLESTAQPPIAQTDLLTYLAFGRDATSLLQRQGSALSGQGGDAGELVGNVAGLATQQLGTIALSVLIDDLEAEMMDELGVDVFRITPADLPPDMFTGRYVDLLRSTEVEAGRYISSRLFVAGQINTGVSRPGIRVEYVGPFGVQWLTSWTSRWMATVPTLTERDPRRAGVLGSFLSREWRY